MNSISSLLILFAALILILILYFVLRIITLRRILRDQIAAYNRGDHNERLRIVERFRTGKFEQAHYLFFRGGAYYDLGRLNEAEVDLRQSLSISPNPKYRTICRDELGLVLLERARYDEALACFRECVAECPQRGGGHRGIAETLLRRGGEAAAALAAARMAVQVDRAARVEKAWLGREAHDLNLAESLGLFAWALARNSGETAEVEGSLKEAFKWCGEKCRPVLARVHYCAGQAYSSLGEATKSAFHFGRASGLDLLGNYGRLARSARVGPQAKA